MCLETDDVFLKNAMHYASWGENRRFSGLRIFAIYIHVPCEIKRRIHN